MRTCARVHRYMLLVAPMCSARRKSRGALCQLHAGQPVVVAGAPHAQTKAAAPASATPTVTAAVKPSAPEPAKEEVVALPLLRLGADRVPGVP